MSKSLPNFKSLEAFYPATETAQAVKSRIGGAVNQEHYHNTCIMRISQSLNYAGQLIPKDSEKFRTKMGHDKKWYGLRVSEFWEYMLKTYGRPIVYARRGKDGSIPLEKFAGFQGIIGFRAQFTDSTGHFTLWDGDQLAYGGESHNYWKISSEAALWGDPSIQVLVAPV